MAPVDGLRYWAAPEVTGIGRLPSHAIVHDDRLNLDGAWDFQLLAAPEAEPVPDAWRSIRVPGAWTMQDVGDIPIYTAQRVPFDSPPPEPPSSNPTGVYRRRFELPASWSGRRVVLHVGAATSVLIVEVNGLLVGVGKDSRLAGEFDLTPHVRAGTNELRLTVVRYSDASFVENQDGWWHGGITRSVYLYVTGRVHLGDVQVRAGYARETGAGRCRIAVTVGDPEGRVGSGWQVRATLAGASASAAVSPTRVAAPQQGGDQEIPLPEELVGLIDGGLDVMDVASRRAAGAPAGPDVDAAVAIVDTLLVPERLGQAHLALEVPHALPWSAESPELYDLIVELLDPSNAVIDSTLFRIGFRDVVVCDGQLLVNGEPVLIQGVNRHDVHPRTGTTLSRDEIDRQLRLLKRYGINAIRTAHYPNDPVVLELCDLHGFYVVAEADIESHNYSTTLCDDPRYTAAFVDRVSRMALRDANHPSVILWSLGNESSFGANHHAAAAWLRAFDPTRPLFYEGAIMRDWYAGHAVTDVVAPMYPSVEALRMYAADPRADRPLIMSEYSHAMGNSNGGLDEYWAAIESSRLLQGGFIWELTDHALDPSGDGRYRYGGDFGDTPNDGNFCVDGLISADGTPHPAMEEVRRLFGPLAVDATVDDVWSGTIRVTNRQFFASAALFELSARVDTLAGDGAEHRVALPPIPARATVEVPLPSVLLAEWEPRSLGVTCIVRLARDTTWAAAGAVIAELQVAASDLTAVGFASDDGALRPLTQAELDTRWAELLVAAPGLDLWRAPTDNDAALAHFGRFAASGFAEPGRLPLPERVDGGLGVDRVALTADDRSVVHERSVGLSHDDVLVVRERVIVPDAAADRLLRIGTRLDLPSGYRWATWWGRGPHEAYPDRKRSARLGRWSAQVDELATPYLRPQENGSRADTWCIEVSGPGVPALRVVLDRPLQVGLSRHLPRELAAARHWWELEPGGGLHLHLDVAQRGIGSTSVGPDVPPEHRILAGTYEWTWRIERLTP